MLQEREEEKARREALEEQRRKAAEIEKEEEAKKVHAELLKDSMTHFNTLWGSWKEM